MTTSNALQFFLWVWNHLCIVYCFHTFFLESCSTVGHFFLGICPAAEGGVTLHVIELKRVESESFCGEKLLLCLICWGIIRLPSVIESSWRTRLKQSFTPVGISDGSSDPTISWVSTLWQVGVPVVTVWPMLLIDVIDGPGFSWISPLSNSMNNKKHKIHLFFFPLLCCCLVLLFHKDDVFAEIVYRWSSIHVQKS